MNVHVKTVSGTSCGRPTTFTIPEDEYEEHE